jgi:flagellar basal-body rod modification protein FlgD
MSTLSSILPSFMSPTAAPSTDPLTPAAPIQASSSTPTTAASSSSTPGVDDTTIAGNFQAFLTLLTTQLQNQNPLDPLDTNQFTQQLVQFAQVEQQLKSNDLLNTLTVLQNATLATGALNFVGATVVIAGDTTSLTKGTASWGYSTTKPATATFNITDSTGRVVYTGTQAINPGNQQFTWNGKGTDGKQLPDGSYKLSITAKDTNGDSVAVSTDVQGVVDSVDLTQNPPVLTIGGQTFTLDKIKRVVRGNS